MALDYVTSRDSDGEIFNLVSRHVSSPSSSANSFDSNSSGYIRKHRFDDRSQTKVSLALKEHSNIQVSRSSSTMDLTELIQERVIHWKEAEGISKIVSRAGFILNYGQVQYVEPSSVYIALGTDKGFIVVFNYHQSIEAVLRCGPLNASTSENSPKICTLKFSSDSTFLAAGLSSGSLCLWDMTEGLEENNSTILPATYEINPLTAEQLKSGEKEGHQEGNAIRQIIFLNLSSLQMITIDVSGMAVYHLGLRKLLHTYFNSSSLLESPTSETLQPRNYVLHAEMLPLGNSRQFTDDLGVVAVVTKSFLRIISTLSLDNSHNLKIITHYQMKARISKELHNSLSWYPTMVHDSQTTNARLAFSQGDVLSIIEVQNASLPSSLISVMENLKNKDKSIPLIPMKKMCKWVAAESEKIMEVKWLSANLIYSLIEDQFRMEAKIKMFYYHSNSEFASLIEIKSELLNDLKPVPLLLDLYNSSHKVKSYCNSFEVYKQNFLMLVEGNDSNKVFFGRILSWADNIRSLVSKENYSMALVIAYSFYTLEDKGLHLLFGLPEVKTKKYTMLLPYLISIMRANIKRILKKGDEELDIDIFFDIISHIWDIADRSDLLEIIESSFEAVSSKRLFFDSLESYLLSGKISALSPSVLKQLVEFYIKNSRGAILTEIICILDVKDLDIDLTIQLCNEYNLRECLIYIWNFLLVDYATPLVDFIKDIESNMENKSLSIVFTYMSYILTGRQFPTEKFISLDIENIARDEICDILFSIELISWPRNSTNILRAKDVVFPYLYLLLKFDSFELLSTLNEFFEDTYLNGEKKFSRQYIVDALLDVYEVNEFKVTEDCQLAIFIARNYPKYPQFIRLSESVLSKVVDRLCSNSDKDLRIDCELALQSLLTRFDSDDDVLLQKIKSAKFFNVLFNIYRSEGSYSKVLEMWIEIYKQDNNQTISDESYTVLLDDCFRMTKSITEKLNLVHVIKRSFVDFASISLDDFVKTITKYEYTLHYEILNVNNEFFQYKYLHSLFTHLNSLAKNNYDILPFISTYSLLLCKYEKNSLFDVLEKHIEILQRNNEVFEKVKEVVKDHHEVQALALILLHEKSYSKCLSVLIDQMKTLSNTSDGDNDKEFKKLFDYAMIVCESPATYDIKDGELSLNENLWLSLIESCADIANKKVSESSNYKFFNRCIHDCFLRISDIKLNTSEQKKKSFLAIFNNFLERSSKESATLSNIRDILQDVFVSYSYESELLNILLRMLNEDIHKEMHNISFENSKGWSIKVKHCTFCSKPLYGGDISEDNYNAWEIRSRNLILVKGKLQNQPAQDFFLMDSYKHTTLVFFKCGHGYHLKCIEGTNRSLEFHCMICVPS